MKYREAIERILADADALSWDKSAAGGPRAAEEYADQEIGKLIAAERDAVTIQQRPAVSISVNGFESPPADREAEAVVIGWLMLLQPGEPTRAGRVPGVAYFGDYDCGPARIWRELVGDDFDDPFLRWLFFAMADASRRVNWVAYILSRRGEAETLGVEPGRLGVTLATIAERHCGHWSLLPYWLDRLKQFRRRREDYRRGLAIVRGAFSGVEQ